MYYSEADLMTRIPQVVMGLYLVTIVQMISRFTAALYYNIMYHQCTLYWKSQLK